MHFTHGFKLILLFTQVGLLVISGLEQLVLVTKIFLQFLDIVELNLQLLRYLEYVQNDI